MSERARADSPSCCKHTILGRTKGAERGHLSASEAKSSAFESRRAHQKAKRKLAMLARTSITGRPRHAYYDELPEGDCFRKHRRAAFGIGVSSSHVGGQITGRSELPFGKLFSLRVPIRRSPLLGHCRLIFLRGRELPRGCGGWSPQFHGKIDAEVFTWGCSVAGLLSKTTTVSNSCNVAGGINCSESVCQSCQKLLFCVVCANLANERINNLRGIRGLGTSESLFLRQRPSVRM